MIRLASTPCRKYSAISCPGDTRQQKMFLIAGPKRGGKGTIGRVLTKMIGRHNVAGPTLAGLGADFGMQGLIGKPVAIISDAWLGSKSDGSIITERLLSISCEDKLTVNRKFLPAWDGYLPTRIVVLSNELPRFTDSSGALASRFMVLMLDKSFYGNENPALTEELCEELPGIFNWALDGLQQLRARGRFEQPVTSADMEDMASPIGAFIRDRCELGRDKWIEVDLLYQKYRQWCDENGHSVTSKAVFGRNLKSARPEIKRRQIGSAQTPTYVGVRLMNSHVYPVSGDLYSRDTRRLRRLRLPHLQTRKFWTATTKGASRMTNGRLAPPC
jgi:putative DNA primase/helicase